MPEVGGSTSFTNAGVFIKPVKGMATFFSYMGLDRKMDTGMYKYDHVWSLVVTVIIEVHVYKCSTYVF